MNKIFLSLIASFVVMATVYAYGSPCPQGYHKNEITAYGGVVDPNLPPGTPLDSYLMQKDEWLCAPGQYPIPNMAFHCCINNATPCNSAFKIISYSEGTNNAVQCMPTN
jgi:hypothetical protein